MKRMLVVLLLGAVAGVGGCVDSTEPTEVIEVRVAHVAPGAGAFRVGVDGQLLAEGVQAGQFTYLQLAVQAHTFSFENQTLDLSVEVPGTSPITAVLLMNEPEPELRMYPLTWNDAGQRLVVVNADTAAADLTISLEGAADPISVTLGRGESEAVEPPTGGFDVVVHAGDPEQAVVVNTIELRATDHGFLVIYPGTGEIRWQRLIF